MEKKKTRHSVICEKMAEWLLENFFSIYVGKMYWIVTELVTLNTEQPDVFGFNNYGSVMVEVKTSRSDFLRDKKKPFRLKPEIGIGEYRFYCCPTGLIKEDELPPHFGLFYIDDNDNIEMIKCADKQDASASNERLIIASIFRRENIKHQYFKY